MYHRNQFKLVYRNKIGLTKKRKFNLLDNPRIRRYFLLNIWNLSVKHDLLKNSKRIYISIFLQKYSNCSFCILSIQFILFCFSNF